MTRPNFEPETRVCRECKEEKPLATEFFRPRNDLKKPGFATRCRACESQERSNHKRQLRLLKNNPKWQTFFRSGGENQPAAPAFREVVGHIDKAFGGAQKVARELKTQLDLASEKNPGGQVAIRGYIEIFKFYKWAAEMEADKIDAHNLSDDDLDRLVTEVLLGSMSAEEFAEVARMRGLTVFPEDEAIAGDESDESE